MLSEAQYETLALATLTRIEELVESSAPDIEFESEDEVLTLEFPDHTRIIINRQRPVRQIWVAARSGGYHYDYDPEHQAWRRTDGHELFSDLEQFASQQLGTPVRLRPA
ncbi:MAG: iron donor protein CyaY [Acidiferrobacter sp.]